MLNLKSIHALILKNGYIFFTMSSLQNIWYAAYAIHIGNYSIDISNLINIIMIDSMIFCAFLAFSISSQ